jgi:hypothetical protein
MAAGDLLDYPASAEYLSARITGYTEEQLREAKYRDELPFVPLGRKIYFLEADLDAFIEQIKARRVEPSK